MKRRVLALVFVGINLLGILLVLAWFLGPKIREESYCAICGRLLTTEKWIGFTIERTIRAQSCADWVDSLLPEHCQHEWVYNQVLSGQEWFGREFHGPCNGTSVIWAIYSLRSELGEDKARELLFDLHALSPHTKSNHMDFWDEKLVPLQGD